MFTNSTPNYGLPQWIGSDKPTYLVDQNSAYKKIDEEIYAASQEATSASSVADNAKSQADTAISTANSALAQAKEVVDTANEALTVATNANTNAGAAKTAADTANTTAKEAKTAVDNVIANYGKVSKWSGPVGSLNWNPNVTVSYPASLARPSNMYYNPQLKLLSLSLINFSLSDKTPSAGVPVGNIWYVPYIQLPITTSSPDGTYTNIGRLWVREESVTGGSVYAYIENANIIIANQGKLWFGLSMNVAGNLSIARNKNSITGVAFLTDFEDIQLTNWTTVDTNA